MNWKTWFKNPPETYYLWITDTINQNSFQGTIQVSGVALYVVPGESLIHHSLTQFKTIPDYSGYA